MSKSIKKHYQEVDYLMRKKKNLNNQFNFLFGLIIFSLESEPDMNKNTYLSFDVYISNIKIIVYFFFLYMYNKTNNKIKEKI